MTKKQWKELANDKGTKINNLTWGGNGERLKGYNGQTVPITATFWAWIETEQKARSYEYFFVVDAPVGLLEYRTAMRLNAIAFSHCDKPLEINQVGKEKSFPMLPGNPVKLSVDVTVKPVRQCRYHVPLAFEESTQQQLDDLEQRGIIEKAAGDTPWMSELRTVEKGAANEEERQARAKLSPEEKAKTKRRLVVDMRAVNKAIIRWNHPMPVLDNFLPQLKGSKWFTKLDLKDAFYHIPLHKDSRHLTSFMTAKGPRQFTRMPFGISCAPEYFQNRMEELFRGCEGCINFADDILIYAKTEEDIDKRTRAVMNIISEARLTLNDAKCVYKVQEIDFLGYTINEEGIRPTHSKLKAIENFRAPETKTELKSFLGLVNYIGASITNLADKTYELSQLTHNNTKFIWTPRHEEMFQELKMAATEKIKTRGFFDNEKTTVIYTDASPHGLGAVLAQREKEKSSPEITIACASKTLTATEQKYPQTQREALAIVWAVERFSHYLLGREFIIVTDHRPLAFIFDRCKITDKRSLTRAEGWALRLSNYRYTIEVVNSEGNVADAPSRLNTTDDKAYEEDMDKFGICAVDLEMMEYGSGRARIDKKIVVECTETDSITQKIKTALETDTWEDEDVKRYKAVKDELDFEDGMLTRRGKIILPAELRPIATKIAHLGHTGAPSMKRHLRDHFWWPGMDADADRVRETCEVCIRMEKVGPPLVMTRTTMPSYPWEYLAIDFYSKEVPCAIKVVVLQDYLSKYVKVAFINATSTKETASFLEAACEDLWLPKKIISDNGPPFQSQSFNDFCKERGIELKHSAPGHPAANGLVERFMQNLQRALTAAIDEGETSVTKLKEVVKNLAFTYNRRPHSVTGKTPFEILHGQKCEDIFPFIKDNDEDEELRNRIEKIMLKGKEYQDKRKRAKPIDIKVGDEVAMINFTPGSLQTQWKKGWHRVVRKEGADAYVDVDGVIMRRNLMHVKKKPESNENQKKPKPGEEEEIADKDPKGSRRRTDKVKELDTN